MVNSSFAKASIYDSVVKLQNAIKQVGGNESLVTQIKDDIDKKNYEKLYQNYIKLLPALKQQITEPWQLIVLSDDHDAFDVLIQTAEYTNTNLNILHLAALTSPAHLQKTASDDNVKSQSENGWSALQYAILSENLHTIDTVLKFEDKNKKIQFPLVDKEGCNIVMLAATTRNVDVFKRVLTLAQDRGIDIHAVDNAGFNVGNYEARFHNSQIQRELLRLGVKYDLHNQKNFHFGEIVQPQFHCEPQ